MKKRILYNAVEVISYCSDQGQTTEVSVFILDLDQKEGIPHTDEILKKELKKHQRNSKRTSETYKEILSLCALYNGTREILFIEPVIEATYYSKKDLKTKDVSGLIMLK